MEAIQGLDSCDNKGFMPADSPFKDSQSLACHVITRVLVPDVCSRCEMCVVGARCVWT